MIVDPMRKESANKNGRPIPSLLDHRKKHSQQERSRFPLVLRGFPLPARAASSIQIPRDGSALRQSQEPAERFWRTSGPEKANGKHVAQHRRRQAAILKTSPCTEPLKELRENILG